MLKKNKLRESSLIDRHEFVVRFSECDAMNVVWHGSYVLYLEDGRESFGKHYVGIGYEDYFNARIVAPVVNMNINYKQSMRSGERGIVETRYVECEGAKIIFEYIIYRASDMSIMATAETTQVFTTLETGEMQYVCPEFYNEWKKRWLKK